MTKTDGATEQVQAAISDMRHGLPHTHRRAQHTHTHAHAHTHSRSRPRSHSASLPTHAHRVKLALTSGSTGAAHPGCVWWPKPQQRGRGRGAVGRVRACGRECVGGRECACGQVEARRGPTKAVMQLPLGRGPVLGGGESWRLQSRF